MTWQIARAGSDEEGWFRDMVFANGNFIATGDGDLFYSSTDGLNWTLHTPVDRARNAGVYFKGKYVSLELKTGADFVDYDGDPIDSIGWATDMKVVGDRIVAIGRNGSLGTSDDGTRWVDRREILGESFWSVAFGANVFVIQDQSPSRLFTSTNGKFWTLRFQGNNGFRTNVAFGSGTFCVLTRERTCVRSTDGMNWEETDAVMPFISDTRGLHYLNGRFVTVGNGGGIASSTDNGLAWTTHDSGTDTRLTDIAYLNGRYIAVGFSEEIYSSPDLKTWTARESEYAGSPIVTGRGKFIAFNPAGTSTDGITWTLRHTRHGSGARALQPPRQSHVRERA